MERSKPFGVISSYGYFLLRRKYPQRTYYGGAHWRESRRKEKADESKRGKEGKGRRIKPALFNKR